VKTAWPSEDHSCQRGIAALRGPRGWPTLRTIAEQIESADRGVKTIDHRKVISLKSRRLIANFQGIYIAFYPQTRHVAISARAAIRAIFAKAMVVIPLS
jgi:hypothetical protein